MAFGMGLLMKLARQIDGAVQEELTQEQGRIMQDLRQLHRAIEDGALDEATFEAREAALLHRLQQIRELRR